MGYYGDLLTGSTFAKVASIVRLERLPDGTIVRMIDASEADIVITAP